jgi:peptidyl-prolyl cis-trans isomerase C
MKYLRTVILLAGVIGLAACQPKAAGTAGPDAGSNSKPVASVNGTPIGADLYEFYAKQIDGGRPSTELTAQQRDQALDNLVRGEVVAQQAAKDGLDKNTTTASQLELARLNVLQSAVSEQYLKDKKPTEQELRAEYETQVAALPKLEYHAKHILVATEPFAQKVVADLEKGAKFEDVAKRESMDPSKENGGDLGWFTPDRMDKSFADAVLGLKPGEYTRKPVQTQFGWHVIQLIETREVAAPPFDNVRQRLEQVVQTKKFRVYTDDLMKTAKVEKSLPVVVDKKAADASAPKPADAPKPN